MRNVVKKKEEEKMRKKINQYIFSRKRGSLNAKELLDDLISEYPNNDYVRFEEALYNIYNNELEKGYDILVDLVERNRKNKKAAMMEAAKVAIKIDEFEKCKSYCDILFIEEYKLEIVEYLYGKYYEKNDDYEEAVKHYENALNLGNKAAKTCLFLIKLKDNSTQKDIKNYILEEDSSGYRSLVSQIKYSIEVGKTNFAHKKCLELERRLMYNYSDAYIRHIFETYLKIGRLDDATRIINNFRSKLSDDLLIFLKGRLSMYQSDYQESIKNLEVLLDCDSDYEIESLLTLIIINIRISDIEKAKECCYKVLNSDAKIGKVTAAIRLINIYIKENDIENAEELLNSLLKLDIKGEEEHTIRQLEAIINTIKNKKNDVVEKNYSIDQIYNYSIEKTVLHINKHKEGVSDREDLLIRKEIDNLELLKDVEEKIKYQTCNFFDTFDHYIIHYPNIGTGCDKTSDYLEVITIPNTTNIITIFPINNDKYCNKSNQEVKLEEKKKVKTNRKSQIEKFNERYSKI